MFVCDLDGGTQDTADCPTGCTDSSGGDMTISSGAASSAQSTSTDGDIVLKTGATTQMTVSPTTIKMAPGAGDTEVVTVAADGVAFAQDVTLESGKVLKTASGGGAVTLSPEGTSVLTVSVDDVSFTNNAKLLRQFRVRCSSWRVQVRASPVR